jgi:hypothetical protein
MECFVIFVMAWYWFNATESKPQNVVKQFRNENMRKKLYFDKTVSLITPMYILIDNGKIREFEGADLTPAIFSGKSVIYETHYTNSDFEIIKLSKYDRKKQEINANYQIKSNYLFSNFIKDTYINLNIFEKFLIDYDKKQSVFHKMNFNQKLISTLFFVTIPFLFTVTWNYFENKSKKIEAIQSPKPDSTKINQEIKIPKIKADTISTQKTN